MADVVRTRLGVDDEDVLRRFLLTRPHDYDASAELLLGIVRGTPV